MRSCRGGGGSVVEDYKYYICGKEGQQVERTDLVNSRFDPGRLNNCLELFDVEVRYSNAPTPAPNASESLYQISEANGTYLASPSSLIFSNSFQEPSISFSMNDGKCTRYKSTNLSSSYLCTIYASSNRKMMVCQTLPCSKKA